MIDSNTKKSKEEAIQYIVDIATINGHSTIKTTVWAGGVCTLCNHSIYSNQEDSIDVDWGVTLFCGTDTLSTEQRAANWQLVDYLNENYEGIYN